MKFLFFGDLHLHNFTQFGTRLPSGRNSRLQDQLNVVQQVKQTVIDRAVDVVIFLGDWFHSRTKIDVDVFSAGFSAMRDLASTGSQIYMLVGNHDLYARVGAVNSLEAFKSIATVVDNPVVRQIRQHGETVKFALFPYTANTEVLIKQFDALPEMDFVGIHQAVREGAVGPYGATGHGEISTKDMPLDRVRYVLSADYHKRQFLANGKFHYIGSPLQLNFGESGEEKAFSLIDTNTWEIETIPTKAPRFYTFATPDEFVKAVASQEVRPDIDFIRCYYKDEKDIAEDIRLAETRVLFEQERKEIQALQRIDPETACDDRALLEAYLMQKDLGGLNPDKLMQLGLELLNSAL